MRLKTNDSRTFVTVCLNQVMKCFLHIKLLSQMVYKIKKRFAEDIGRPNRITSDKAKFPNAASLATNE